MLVATFNAARISDRAQSTYHFLNRFNPDQPIRSTPDQPHWDVSPAKSNHPVVGISWRGAALVAYLLGGRLPYVAEWREFAPVQPGARYPWGDEEVSEKLANVAQFVGDTTPVGQYQGHNGLFDLIGNAEEWCMDWYEAGALMPPARVGPGRRYFEKAVVGGSWATPVWRTGISVYRGKWCRIGTRSIGCRVVWDDTETTTEVGRDPFGGL